MGNLTLVGSYSPRFKAGTVEKPYADYTNLETAESWYVYADNLGEWLGKGLFIVVDATGRVVQNSLMASSVSPDDASVWLLEGATEELLEIGGFQWILKDSLLVSEPNATDFSRNAALAYANTMIGLYEDLSDVHAEADWRNYRSKAFNWVDGDATPEAPVN